MPEGESATLESAFVSACATSRSTVLRMPGSDLMVSVTAARNSDGVVCAIGMCIVARMPSRGGGVHGVGDHADDFPGDGRTEWQTHGLPNRLAGREKPAHERLVHDRHRTAPHAVSGLEVPAEPDGDAHGVEPAW